MCGVIFFLFFRGGATFVRLGTGVFGSCDLFWRQVLGKLKPRAKYGHPQKLQKRYHARSFECCQHDVSLLSATIHWTLLKCENLIDSRVGFHGRDQRSLSWWQRKKTWAVGGWLRPKFLVRQVWCSYGIGIVWLEWSKATFHIFIIFLLRLRSMKLLALLLWLLWLVTVISTISTVSTCRFPHPRLHCWQRDPTVPLNLNISRQIKGVLQVTSQSFRDVKVGSFFADMNQCPWCGNVRSGTHHALRGRKKDRHSHVLCAAMPYAVRNCSRYMELQ